MALSLPTYLYDTAPEICRAGNAVISGSDSAIHGLRGIPALSNHVYAYRVSQIAHHCEIEFATSWADTTSVDWVDLTMLVPYPLGPNVISVVVYAYIEDGYLRLYVEDEDAWSATSDTGYTAGLTKVIVSRAINDDTGIEHRIKLCGKTDAGEHAYYYGYTIVETVLTAGDIP